MRVQEEEAQAGAAPGETFLEPDDEDEDDEYLSTSSEEAGSDEDDQKRYSRRNLLNFSFMSLPNLQALNKEALETASSPRSSGELAARSDSPTLRSVRRSPLSARGEREALAPSTLVPRDRHGNVLDRGDGK